MSEVAVLLISEDNSKWALETLEQLCRRIFDWITPRYADGAWLTFAPASAAAREAVPGNRWQSKKPRDQPKILRLCKQIAEQVLRGDGFVFFHVDSDVAWGAGRSPNLDRFEQVIHRKVRDIVRGHLAKSNVDEAQIAARMSKLIMLAPHYSIEAWLFANVARLRECGAVGPILDQWQADAATLEQTVNPKQLVSVSTRDYPTLARELRTAELYALQTSFADTVNRAGACGSLVVRLRGRWPQWVRTAHGLD